MSDNSQPASEEMVPTRCVGYLLQIKTNADMPSERWTMQPDMYGVRRTLDEAQADRATALEAGYDPTHLRVIGMYRLVGMTDVRLTEPEMAYLLNANTIAAHLAAVETVVARRLTSLHEQLEVTEAQIHGPGGFIDDIVGLQARLEASQSRARQLEDLMEGPRLAEVLRRHHPSTGFDAETFQDFIMCTCGELFPSTMAGFDRRLAHVAEQIAMQPS